ncbi:hypothetical protein B0A50_05439 [Salinomyces thailandicus]|uniref:Uncharacterized protein n=1 Tax=Salinomyces thailandicus TaxID=706561 RepID=A0A4U0TTP2_9PEZI|nr:hypothetical protein B0A50_05439 [Salinomyces thailandica]
MDIKEEPDTEMPDALRERFSALRLSEDSDELSALQLKEHVELLKHETLLLVTELNGWREVIAMKNRRIKDLQASQQEALNMLSETHAEELRKVVATKDERIQELELANDGLRNTVAAKDTLQQALVTRLYAATRASQQDKVQEQPSGSSQEAPPAAEANTSRQRAPSPLPLGHPDYWRAKGVCLMCCLDEVCRDPECPFLRIGDNSAALKSE